MKWGYMFLTTEGKCNVLGTDGRGFPLPSKGQKWTFDNSTGRNDGSAKKPSRQSIEN